MGTLVSHADPLPSFILPEHKLLAKELNRIWLPWVERTRECHCTHDDKTQFFSLRKPAI